MRFKPVEKVKCLKSHTDGPKHVLDGYRAPQGHFRAESMCGFGGGESKEVMELPLATANVCYDCLRACMEESATMRAHWPFNSVVKLVQLLKRRGIM